jgi:hypothetical protein
VAARSKAWVCGHSVAEIAGSNADGGVDVRLFLVNVVLSGRGLYDGPIARPEASYAVCVCVIECHQVQQ